jgi:sugar phosphate isomerase/epimerase
MKISCCIWALPIDEEVAVPRVAEMGFSCIDVRPPAFERPEVVDATVRVGLGVSCLAASFGLPEGASLDHEDAAPRAGGTDGSEAALARYAAVVGPLAQRAQDRGLSLSLEHFPGLSLPTVAATRDFVERVDHPNLHVLVDIGHAQMEGITPAAAVDIAGDRLGYVHLDDNDGVGDLHQGLLDGMLTEKSLADTFSALTQVGYEGAVSLELNATLEDPAAALTQSLQIVRNVLGS